MIKIEFTRTLIDDVYSECLVEGIQLEYCSAEMKKYVRDELKRRWESTFGIVDQNILSAGCMTKVYLNNVNMARTFLKIEREI